MVMFEGVRKGGGLPRWPFVFQVDHYAGGGV